MIDGIAAAQWLLNYGSVTPSRCLYYVWQAYKAQGASTGLSAQTAYAAWGLSDGQRPGDRNPPAGAAVWWGRRTWDGNTDGDVVISLGGGRVACTEPPHMGYVTGSCTLDERENEISREYLGWTSSIFDCPINVAAGKDAALLSPEEDNMPLNDDDKNWIREAVRQELGGALQQLAASTEGFKDWERLMVRQEVAGSDKALGDSLTTQLTQIQDALPPKV